MSITADGNIKSPLEPRWFGPPFVPSVARRVGSIGASLTSAICQNTSVSVVPL